MTNRSSVKTMKVAKKTIITVITALLVFFWLFPVVLGASTSLKTDKDFVNSPLALPERPTLDSYRYVLSELDFLSLLKNSFIYSIGGTILAIILSIFPAYVLSRYKVPFGNAIFVIFLTSLMIPQQTVVIGLYELLNSMGILNTRICIILVHGIYGISYVMLLLRGYIVGIPRELEWAARIDGCSDFQVIRYVILPCMVPGFAVAGTLNFISIWNELFFSQIFLDSQKIYPVSVGLSSIKQGKYFVAWNIPMAAAVLSILPVIIIYSLAYRYIKDGLFSGAVKG